MTFCRFCRYPPNTFLSLLLANFGCWRGGGNRQNRQKVRETNRDGVGRAIRTDKRSSFDGVPEFYRQPPPRTHVG